MELDRRQAWSRWWSCWRDWCRTHAPSPYCEHSTLQSRDTGIVGFLPRWILDTTAHTGWPTITVTNAGVGWKTHEGLRDGMRASRLSTWILWGATKKL